jgi:hypothetical protein
MDKRENEKLEPNVVVEWLTLLLRIREVPGSNLDLETGYPHCDFRGFPQFLQANVRIVPQMRPRPLSSTHIPIHHLPIILLFDVIF